MSKIRVLIADDHPMVQQGLKTFLGLSEEIEVVGEASNGEEVVQKAQALAPDVILMDLIMPVMNGTVAIEELKARGIESKVIVLTSFSDEKLIQQALKSGAIGYLMKDVRPRDLVEAIVAASHGVPQLHPEVTKKLLMQLSAKDLPGQGLFAELTERELEVLANLAEGLSNKEIAGKLHVTVKTVKAHVSSIIQKLGVNTRTQAALLAVKNNLTQQH